ncbi:uncharacterized protein [Lepeophtheirus salmonis]|nr:uncharacterized protein LOC121131792 isoform X2 [Lepeophtheirus salmonis]
MSVSEDSINLCLMSSVHACKETLYVSFRDSSTVQDVLNYYLIRVQAPGIGKVSYILLNDQRVPCKPESTLSKVLGKDVKSASLILSVSQVSETRRLDLILIIGICYFFWITSLVIGLVMYLTHGWSSHGGSLTIINAYSHGTELYLFKSHERNARFTCSINSSAGISVLINSPSELNLKYYFTNFHCFNKSLSSSVYLGATDGLRELNQTLPCETRELMTKVKNTLSSIVSDSFVEILTNTKQGILGWRGIHSKSGGNQTTADWGKFSLQVTFPTKDSNQTNNLNYLTLDNYGGKII